MRGAKLTAGQVAKARRLRRSENEVEHRAWNLLRGRSVEGLKFLRQFPIGPFGADFVCRHLMLVVEVDGGQHADNAEYDARRTAFMNARGYSVLRFWNSEILHEVDGVHRMLVAIKEGFVSGPSPGWRFSPATLSPEGRGDPTAVGEHETENQLAPLGTGRHEAPGEGSPHEERE